MFPVTIARSRTSFVMVVSLFFLSTTCLADRRPRDIKEVFSGAKVVAVVHVSGAEEDKKFEKYTKYGVQVLSLLKGNQIREAIGPPRTFKPSPQAKTGEQGLAFFDWDGSKKSFVLLEFLPVGDQVFSEDVLVDHALTCGDTESCKLTRLSEIKKYLGTK